MRRLADISHIACGVRSLAHCLDRTADAVYAGMRRDAALRIPALGVVAYAPSELSDYLFRMSKLHVVVDFAPEGAPVHWWGVRQPSDVYDWGQRGRKLMLAFVINDERGHWVGYDGRDVCGLRQLGFKADYAPWIEFRKKTGLNQELIGRTVGVGDDRKSIHAQYAILIED